MRLSICVLGALLRAGASSGPAPPSEAREAEVESLVQVSVGREASRDLDLSQDLDLQGEALTPEELRSLSTAPGEFEVKLVDALDRVDNECPEHSSRRECHILKDLLGTLIKATRKPDRSYSLGTVGMSMPEMLRRAVTRKASTAVLNASTQEGTAAPAPEDGGAARQEAASAVFLEHWLHTRHAFDAMDSNGDGLITLKEADATARRTGQVWSQGERVFRVMDLDRDGSLSRQDVHAFLRAAVFARDLLPELDPQDPDRTLGRALFRAHEAVVPQAPMQHVKMIGAIVVGLTIWANIAFFMLFSTTAKGAAPDARQEAARS